MIAFLHTAANILSCISLIMIALIISYILVFLFNMSYYYMRKFKRDRITSITINNKVIMSLKEIEIALLVDNNIKLWIAHNKVEIPFPDLEQAKTEFDRIVKTLKKEWRYDA